ncbi:hypothetical protein [Singulisphaera sp. PoT]|uniref:hypothetical protein n=1 Tax=Singulisphaera sp. PoT TaxID=3411797 RepID=UPI003BF53451
MKNLMHFFAVYFVFRLIAVPMFRYYHVTPGTRLIVFLLLAAVGLISSYSLREREPVV